MYLYYDNISGTFTLQHEDGHREFLGPWDYAAGKLMECGCTEIQAREAMLHAFFNRGLAVSLADTKKMARLISRVA